MTMKRKTYTELMTIPDFEGRLNYLRCYGSVGKETFGYDRYLNQMLYKFPEWREVRRQVIIRDNSCDLAHPDHEIFPYGKKVIVMIHHIIPITKEDILERSDLVLNPDNLITVSNRTHEIIHYGYAEDRRATVVERTPFDTCPWRK